MREVYQLILFVSLPLLSTQVAAQSPTKNILETRSGAYRISKLLFKDDFKLNANNWIIEAPPTSKITIANSELIIDADGGTTVWFKKKLSGNIMIEYKRKVIMNNGRNDRLSDLNQFWMATDPVEKNLFTRTGVFTEYDSLLLYYVGFGGNTNTTTRFRKYTGNGERILYNDLTDSAHLLEPNKEYLIRITVYKGTTKFFVDNKEFFSFNDAHPLKEGYFGFRTTESRQSVNDFKVYRLK